MLGKLLITLRTAGASCTYSFDGTAQSALWVGLARHVGADDALARIENEGGRLTLKAVGESGHGGESDVVELPLDQEFVTTMRRRGTEPVSVFTRPLVPGMGTYRKLGFGGDVEFLVGRAKGSGLLYESRFVSAKHARVELCQGSFVVTDLESGNGTLVNGLRLPALQPRLLVPGDVVQILDLVFAVGDRFLSVNMLPQLRVRVPNASFVTHSAIRSAWPNVFPQEGEPERFYPAPRLSKSIHPIKLQVDDPPAKKEPNNQPVLMSIGPSFFMAMSSVFMVTNSISQMAGGASPLAAMPSLSMAVAMVGGSVLWPVVSRSYNRKRDKRDEARRGRMYVSYLDDVETRLLGEAATQAQTLEENRRPVPELLGRARTLSPLLMSHTSVHDDFMDLRVGVGDEPILADVQWPQRHFSLLDDRMLDRVTELSNNPPVLRDVPLAFNPKEHFVAGILGRRAEVWRFLRGLLVQVCSLYSYQEVKITIVGGDDEREEWEFLRGLGHLYDARGQRLTALSYSGMVRVGLLIERELAARAEERAEVIGDYGTYYLIVCANHLLAERSEAIRRLRKLRSNKGFSLVYLGETLRDLPRECGFIVDLAHDGGSKLGIVLGQDKAAESRCPRSARMFERADVSGTLSQFDPDIFVSKEQANDFALDLARVCLDVPEQGRAMPSSVGFLEMFEVGNASHLNVGQRWLENDASQSLQTPVGIDEQGELAYLNLHESIHGPHGLIAGTTGSGKSEFVITYVLSLCANYAPDEVAFVLIDYKGGGLAGAFENERHHLPHLSGTITNLDGASINRSLVSIRSELKRRQDAFNRARDVTGESTMDIYKYLSFYRQGVLTEALPHLFIVADEFAELKQQEPEFMDELISAARIGRSLGVHLILATQKPSGVVNDQIWSNARFKVCLKVSDAADSREMIKRDDAAQIAQVGRFYLLVGYNESFVLGQAAYAGGAYMPTEAYEPRRDNAVELLDNEGVVVARMRPQGRAVRKLGSELDAVVGQIEDAARVSGKHAQRLWLDPLPSHISLASLRSKYGFGWQDGLVAVVGELDDPSNQRQRLYSIDLASKGNVLLYGSQASGVDGLLQTMVFSLLLAYNTSNVQVYGIDLGAGTLSVFCEFPQCGGIVLPNEHERLQSLVRMLSNVLRDRQAALASHGGSAAEYKARTGSEPHHIVVAISNLASFAELHPNLEDALVFLTREGPRYGIHFLVTASTAGSVRMRLAANFAVCIPTWLNDPADYLTILGGMRGITPPQGEKRGLARIGKRVLEFQGASVCEMDEDPCAVVGGATQRLKQEGMEEARPIPQLPEYVHPANMDEQASSALLPVGYSKLDVVPCYFDLSRSPYMLVAGNDNDSVGRYLRGLHEALMLSGRASYRVVDPQGLLGDALPDGNVLSTTEDAQSFVEALCAGEVEVHVVVFTSIAQTLASLSAATSGALAGYIAGERCVGKTSLVCASEAWRVRAVYDDWYKVVSSHGNGIWCGSGFSDQTMFRFARPLAEYRQPADRSDGFLVMRGNITCVRLLEATAEPKEEGR